MTRHFRPLATAGVACAVSAVALVAADEPKAGPRPVVVTKEVVQADAAGKVIRREVTTTTEVMVAPAAPRGMAKAAVVAKGFVMPQVPVAPQVNAQQVQQLTGTFRAILRAEYQLVLTVCEPTKDQRREIARAGERAVTVAAIQGALWQSSPFRLVVKDGVATHQRADQPDPRKILRDALAAAAKAHLPAESTARYLKEVEARAADEKRAVVSNLVEALDQILLLSTDQRAKLTDSLTAGWDDAWAPSVQALMNKNNGYFYCQPPDKLILPALNPPQVKLWQAVQKVQQNSWKGFIGLLGTDDKPLEDAGPDDPPGAAARGPEAKP